ncbi:MULTISPECIES: hypothetical protein [Cysteiniphilum]|uniref:Uncharacterized protein n=1 Tax=Cysteiniphilum litorale TaxID=2056700 RepID=A0A8J2Z6T0_9GAMM|nr:MULTISPECIES: hypothetical protein [Cysteiniphilum]GGG07262.1 hypothetical protein GCM10010995_25990 [Cysteiniphilum litorale]
MKMIKKTTLTVLALTVMASGAIAAAGENTSRNVQTVDFGHNTKVEITVNSGTQAAPAVAIATRDDTPFTHQVPNVYWPASEQNIIDGKTMNNIKNASINTFLKSNGNTVSFRLLADDGSGEGMVPTVAMNGYQQVVAPAFDLSYGKTRKCTVSYVSAGHTSYWTSSCTPV